MKNNNGEFIVHDVGHGNWNEIRRFGKRLFFDSGAGKYLGENDVRKLINSVNFQLDELITLIISHWDTDHYHALLKLEPAEWNKITLVLAPEPPKNTSGLYMNTVNRVLEKFIEYSIQYIWIPRTTKLSNFPKNKVELHLVYEQALVNAGWFNIELYRTTGSKNKNLNSIVLFYEENNNNILLTGDNCFDKVYDYILVNKILKPNFIMVVPHHGGNAGRYLKSTWHALNINIVVCSWGKNNYNHNVSRVISKFQNTTTMVEETNGKSLSYRL